MAAPAFPTLVEVVLAQQNEREGLRRVETLGAKFCGRCGLKLNSNNSGDICSFGRGCRKRGLS